MLMSRRNARRRMNYLVIDLEICKVPRNLRSREYRYATEIIQIGAVLMDEEFNRIGISSAMKFRRSILSMLRNRFAARSVRCLRELSWKVRDDRP